MSHVAAQLALTALLIGLFRAHWSPCTTVLISHHSHHIMTTCSRDISVEYYCCRYSAIEPLHKLWTQYIADLLRNSSHREVLLLDADFHACKLTVTQCPNPRHVRLTGYVITDTPQAFAILSQADKLHHVSKKDTTFQFTLGADEITLFGSQLLKHRA